MPTKIEVRKVKEVKSMSEETLCFQCEVLIDGKVAGSASNDGHGGANRYSQPDLYGRLTEYAKTLPPMTGLPGDPAAWASASLPHDADSALSGLVEDYLSLRDYRKAVVSRVLFESTDGRVLQTRKVAKGQDVLALARTFAGRPNVARVLNLLPEPEGYALFKAHS